MSTKILNPRIFKIMKVTPEEYIKWCEKENKNPYSKKTKKEFFKKIHKYELIRINGNLIDRKEIFDYDTKSNN